jgi:hypothetical protein
MRPWSSNRIQSEAKKPGKYVHIRKRKWERGLGMAVETVSVLLPSQMMADARANNEREAEEVVGLGLCPLIMRECVCPKLIYITRVMPLELWTEPALQLIANYYARQ